YAEPAHRYQILFGKPPRQRQRVDALPVGPVDNLVVHVREILHQRHPVPARFQVFADDRPDQRRPGVSDMRLRVRRHAASVDADVAFFKWMKLFLRPCQRVVDANRLRHCATPPTARRPPTPPASAEAVRGRAKAAPAQRTPARAPPVLAPEPPAAQSGQPWKSALSPADPASPRDPN